MTTKYTPEPWTNTFSGNPANDKTTIYDAGGEVVADTSISLALVERGGIRTQEEADVNAERIVLCVNACAELDRPDTQIPALRKLAAECVALRGTKRELLAALEKIDSNAAESVEWIRRVARAAIAKAQARS